MAKVQRAEVLAMVAEAYGPAAEPTLASALAEAGLADAPAFDSEDVARLGRALLALAGRLAAEAPGS